MKTPEGAAVAEEDEEENKDGTQNADDPKNEDPGLKQGGEPDIDAGRGSEENGNLGGQDEGETGKKEEEDVVDERDQKIAELETEIKAIKEGAAKPRDKEEPVVYSEEQKAQIEQHMGGMPFDQIQSVTRLITRAVNQALGQIEGRFSKTDKQSVIAELSQQTGYTDIGSYTEGIEKYLSKFSPTMHGNRETIIDGLHWARGQGLKNAVQKAMNSREKNKRIAGAARPSAPGGGGGGGDNKGEFKFKLTPLEESAYASFGRHHFKTKEEYAKTLKRYKK